MDKKLSLAQSVEYYLARGGSRAVLEDFAQVSTQTVYAWRTGKQKPNGVIASRAVGFFSAVGIPLHDERFRKQYMHGLAVLFSLGVCTIEGLAKHLGIAQEYVKRIMGGARPLPPKLIPLVTQLCAKHEHELKKRGEDLRAQSGITHTLAPTTDAKTVPPSQPRASATKAAVHDTLLEALALHAKAMLPLAELILSDEYGSADREHLRALAGKNTIFALANALNGLCGERARNQQEVKGRS